MKIKKLAYYRVLPLSKTNLYPFKEEEHVLMLGEIKNMSNHVAVVLCDGRVMSGYHIDNFQILTPEEL
jgi:hypothetical protein